MSFRPRRSLRPVRPRLPRRALPWYLAVIALAVVTTLVVRGSLRRAAEAEAAYGRSRPVAVMVRDVPAGEVVAPDDLTVRRWPTALVPPGALDATPADRTALVPLVAGEALVEARLSGPGIDGPGALLGPDERAVPIPVTVPGLALEVGDRVDVLAGGAIGGGPTGDLPIGATGPDLVVSGATVVAVSEDAVAVAVPARSAADVAAALTAGPLVLALRPPGP